MSGFSLRNICLGVMMYGLLAACADREATSEEAPPREVDAAERDRQSTIWDLFSNIDDPNVKLNVNKYIWNASLDVLNFLPVQTADPFSGVISTGFGTPPGGRAAYRATIYIRDPALDARSLTVALSTRSGPVDEDTVYAIENAILTRARQLRIADSNL